MSEVQVMTMEEFMEWAFGSVTKDTGGDNHKDPKSRYYDAGGIETLDIIKAKLTPEEYIGYLKGNLLKYLSRMAWKHETPERDIEKISYYSKFLKETIDAK